MTAAPRPTAEELARKILCELDFASPWNAMEDQIAKLLTIYAEQVRREDMAVCMAHYNDEKGNNTDAALMARACAYSIQSKLPSPPSVTADTETNR